MVRSHDRDDRTRDVRILLEAVAEQSERAIRGMYEPYGLTCTQACAVRDLVDPLPPSQLAVLLECEPSNVTFVVSRLVSLGYAERRPHPTDRRSKLVALTPRGQEVRRAMLDRLSAESPLERLDDEDLAQLQVLLERVTAHDRAAAPTGV
jgi:DNA-binding MarR family transcriptional regulator